MLFFSWRTQSEKLGEYFESQEQS